MPSDWSFPSSFVLAPLTPDVVKTIEPIAAKNADQVAFNCDGANGTVHADQLRLGLIEPFP
jgi:hypothetical protein